MYCKTLNDVPPDKCFWFCNSTRANNLNELLSEIEHTNDMVFHHHMNDKRQDFARWIKLVLEDHDLFALIEHEYNKYWFIQKVRTHINYLEKKLADEAAA